MDKNVLVQYSERMEEAKDLRQRIQKLQREMDKLEIVSDTVKGSKDYGIYGPIKITGYPDSLYERKKKKQNEYKARLEVCELELLELTCQAEEYIESVPKAEMRMILRFGIIDGLSNAKVAERMNFAFPRRKIKYTDENIKKRFQRFFENFENVPQCPHEKC